MRLRYDNADTGGLVRDNATETESPVNKRRKFAKFFEKALDSVTTKVMAVAVAATVVATSVSGCTMNSMGRYMDDTDTDTHADVEEDEGIDAPDIPDIIEDEVEDSIDAEEMDVEDEEVVEPTCFEIPAALDPGVDTLLNKSSEESITFVGPDTKVIDTTVQKNISVIGYPDIVLGECPDNPDAVAFIAGPVEHTVGFDVSILAGLYSWAATVPNADGTLCEPFTEDSELLISHNTDKQQVPKNVLMGSIPTQAGFLMQDVDSGMVAYEIDGVIESSGTFTVPLGSYTPVTTVKAVVLFGEMDIDVEVPVGDSSRMYTYSATVTGGTSKEARIYPRTLSDNQIYDVVWDESEVTWCARCIGNEVLTLVIPGDLICKVADMDCGCIGDGFTVSIDSVTLDKSAVVYEIKGYYGEADPAVRSTMGVSALSDPTTDHPSVTVTLEKNRTDGLIDSGELARMTAIVDITLTSQHLNLEGVNDTMTYTIRVPVVDPLAFGTSESPNYTEDCGCTPTL